jgi:hypothetical protein
MIGVSPFYMIGGLQVSTRSYFEACSTGKSEGQPCASPDKRASARFSGNAKPESMAGNAAKK